MSFLKYLAFEVFQQEMHNEMHSYVTMDQDGQQVKGLKI